MYDTFVEVRTTWNNHLFLYLFIIYSVLCYAELKKKPIGFVTQNSTIYQSAAMSKREYCTGKVVSFQHLYNMICFIMTYIVYLINSEAVFILAHFLAMALMLRLFSP